MMNNSPQIVSISLLLGTIIAVSAFSIVFNSIPVEALHKEEQFLENFDDLADYAKAVRNGDSDFEEIPIQSMKQADIYDDANDSLKDCIDQAAEIGDSLTDREVVHCVDNVNYFNNKYSNSTVPTTETSTSTTGLNTGTDTTSTSNADTTSTSNADTNTADTNTADTNTANTTTADTTTADTTTADTNTADTNTADTNTADTTSTSDNSNKNTLVDELVKTGKFTEAEAKEFVNNNMQSGTGTDTTSDTTSTSNADTTSTSNADTNTADTNTADTNTADTTSTSNADTKTDSSASDDTSTNNEDNNDQSSNNNSNNPEDYDGLDELVKDIKNGNIDTEEISLSAFQNSGAYQGADQETQDCIDLAGKIGHNLGDQEIVNCSEDPNFYKNEISNNNDNNADDSNNNADDSNNNADENSDSSNDNNN